MALVRPGAPPRRPGLEVVRSLPSVLGAENRPEVLAPLVQRARPPRPAPFVGVVWISKVVVVLVGLARKLGRVAVVLVHRAEAPGPVWVQVEVGLAAGDQLRQRAADAARSP